YLEYDFEGQAEQIMDVARRDSNGSIISITDQAGRVVATSGHYAFLDPHPQAIASTAPQLAMYDGLIVAQATVPSDHGMPGLAFRCVIEDRVATEGEIAAAVGITSSCR
ncbi:hypothetical protein O8I32_07880, partial [Campylobacter lari]|uniref:hypothetical protein n=1 Tax=Campylobacter lari TaxID=201 RepID=UPI00372CB6DA